MRQDLDRLMRERGLAGLVVIAQDRYAPAMHYCTGTRMVQGIYFRRPDGHAHLVYDPMERDLAVAVGCEMSSLAQHRYRALVDEEGSVPRAFGRIIGDVAKSLGISGRVAFHGDLDAGAGWALLTRAREVHGALEVDTTLPDLLTLARTTKNDDEIAAIRRASDAVVAAWNALIAHLERLKPAGEHFTNGGGTAVTLGELRALLHREFTNRGLEGGESIVSQGRDAGVPHNRGNDDEKLRAGAPVIVDIFPGEAGGGYHSDFTRTFVMGRASEELKRVHRDVSDAFRLAMDSLKVGALCRSYQDTVCDLFESRGHATVRSQPTTDEGYVHGLGHGVGLAVHEAPRLAGTAANTTTLAPRMVITIEPGLYYPSRGMGVRIEDLVLVKDDGTFENLTPAPYTFEVATRA